MTTVVRTFRHLADPMLLTVSLLLLVAAGAVAGSLVRWRGPGRWTAGGLSAVIAWLVGVGFLLVGTDATASSAAIAAHVPAAGVGLIAVTLVTSATTLPPGRRRVIKTLGSGLLAASAAGYTLKRLVRTGGRSRSGEALPAPGTDGSDGDHLGTPNGSVTARGRPTAAAPATAGASTTTTAPGDGSRSPRVSSLDLDGLPPRVTPLSEFFTVDIAVTDPVVTADDWRLSVTGAVEGELSLQYDELVERVSETRAVTIECISNEVGGGLVSTGRASAGSRSANCWTRRSSTGTPPCRS